MNRETSRTKSWYLRKSNKINDSIYNLTDQENTVTNTNMNERALL